MRLLDRSAVHLTEVPELPRGAATLDIEWIPFVGKQGWIVVTGDHRIVANPVERKVFVEAKIVAFFMPKGFTKDRLWPQVELLVKAWPNIEELALKSRAGDCYEVQRNGKANPFTPKK